MQASWCSQYPVHWINLERQCQRRERMLHALKSGGWTHQRWAAIDAKHSRHHFRAIPKPWCHGSELPGLQRNHEQEPWRRTTRAELACLTSWQTLIEHLSEEQTPSGWFLLMEDDVGSSLACPEAWPFDLQQLTSAASPSALAIQLAPISSKARQALHHRWQASQGKELVVPKHSIRSHGNGAVLLNQNALPRCRRRLGRWLEHWMPHWHLLSHPHSVRPVADKWLYACLPAESSWVCTYPLFCLDAEDSDLHTDHVRNFHQPSRDLTLKLWSGDGAHNLIRAFELWHNQKNSN